MAEHGYEAATLNRIVEASRVPVSSVYHYFGSKDGVLLAVMERGAALLRVPPRRDGAHRNTGGAPGRVGAAPTGGAGRAPGLPAARPRDGGTAPRGRGAACPRGRDAG